MTATTLPRGAVRAGIDIGGTFTDAVLVDERGSLFVAKVPSAGEDPAAGFEAGLAEVAGRAGRGFAELAYLAHGTTVATNAIVQGRLARAGLITNAGFRDILEIGTQQRRDVYDLWTPQPAPVIPRERCHEVRGRLAADGTVVQPLCEEDVVAAATALRAQAVEAVAVVLLFAFADPAHEERVGALLERELPGIPVALSSRVAPEFREYLRASTTALNAALLPVAGTYVERLSRRLESAGVAAPLHLMQSNGGVATAGRAGRLPVGLVASGPAAGVIGAARIGAALGQRDLLSFDMGGTTADIALVVDGLPQLRFHGDPGGHPVNLPQVDVLSVGAGGGSLASVDRYGSLRVGPESAGAHPGPACYGTGGERPTVTDAHVVLGVLDGERPLAGRMRLDGEAARAAVARHVAGPLGLGVEAGAEAIVRMADANMAAGMRLVSVAQGHDPRDFALVALGGAGPMHACTVADELGVPRVIVPRHPGVTAALGLLLSDVRHDLRQSWIRPTAEAEPAALDAGVERLEREGRALLAGTGTTGGEISFELDMRYRGQAYNLTVPLAPRPVTPETLAAADAAFRAAHEQAYDYTPSVTDTEIVTIRARALGPAGHGPVASPEPGGGTERPARAIWSDGAAHEHAVVARSALADGDVLGARTVVEQEDTTIVVRTGWRGRVREGGALLLEREA